jgi:type VI secretion system protein ImpK
MDAVADPPALPAAPEDAQRAHALHSAARPLITLATQLRHAVLEAPAGMRQALTAAIDRFEHELAAAGWEEAGIVAASYLLCVWVDEVVADTPWGSGGAGLLERFHGERDGGERVLRLLSRLAERPRENRALLELFHACLSLGLSGGLRAAPDGARRLEMLRARLFMALPQDAGALSPPWRSAAPPRSVPWPRRLAVGGLLLLALAAFGVYTASQLRLAAQVDAVFASMQQLSPPAVAAPLLSASSPAVARLAPALAADVAAGRINVQDEAHRSRIALAADTLFEPGSARIAAAAGPLLARVGSELARHGGTVLVVGHTDGRDARSARLPSPWHQSYEWARATADALAQTLPGERLAVEGAAELDEPDAAALPRRRVDIVLYP